jgi:hypothetical protein
MISKQNESLKVFSDALCVDINESACSFEIVTSSKLVTNHVARDSISRLRRCDSSEAQVRHRTLVIIAQWHHPFPFRTRQ